MQEFRNRIAGLCCFNVKNDPVLMGFKKLFGESAEESFEGYSEIVGTVLMSGKTLADYFHDMLIFSDSPILNEFAYGKGETKDNFNLRKEAVKSDLDVIASLCEETAAQIQIRLNTFYDTLDFGKLPLYDNGVFDYTPEYFLDYIRTNGSGLFAKYKAFTFDGELHPIENPDKIRLSDLKNYDVQRKQVIDNTVCFLSGKPAQNVLLYGDRGTGKSSTVKAIMNESKYLRMVEVAKNDIAQLPKLFRKLKDIPLHFIVMIDDLSFA
ncbi:MAG: ATP-binding protein, partial [Oscillospiraceae bacterium]|nr:ATP-binding protein [Oscillospiraceae bacterium]